MHSDSSRWKGGAFRFLTAQTISLFGSSLVQYAIVWHVALTTSSGAMLTLSTLCGFLPQIAVSLFAGVWLDRYDRKKLILLSDTLIALATLALAVAFATGYGSLWLLFAALVVRSAGTGVQAPAVNALLPQLVPKEHLMRVSGLSSTLSSLTMLLSPAASGAVLAVAPLEAALLIDVVTAVLGVAMTTTVHPAPYVPQSGGSASYLEEIGAGFAYLKQNPFVRRLLLYHVAILFLISPSAFLTPLLVSRGFGPEVWRLTLSETTYSLGMVLGGLLITAWGGFRRRLNTTLLAGSIYGLLMLGLGAAPAFPFYLLCNTLIGITAPCYNAPITVSLQERVDPAFQGRVFSLLQIASSCALPAGMILFGPLADQLNVSLILLCTGGLVLLASAIAWGKNQSDWTVN